MFQSMILQSHEPLTIVVSLSQMARVQISVCPARIFMHLVLSLSQTRIEWSEEQDTIFDASGENSQCLIAALCPK